MRAYSQDLRDRILNALERGERPTDIAARFEVSRVWFPGCSHGTDTSWVDQGTS